MRRLFAAFVLLGPAAAPQEIFSLVSTTPDHSSADAYSGRPAVSADARQIAFVSWATNLVPNDNNRHSDIFVHDFTTGATVRESVDSAGAQSNEDSFDVAISSDGRFVVFDSRATNLIAGDNNGSWDIFLRDRDPDGNGVFDEGNGTTTCVSVTPQGVPGNLGSMRPAISADGSKVVFESAATDLAGTDRNGEIDVFLRDLRLGTTTCLSVDPSGVNGDRESLGAAISADGRWAAFASAATTLVANDTNHWPDIFLRDLATATTVRVSVDSTGVQGDFPSFHARLSADGAVVLFDSLADNLVDHDTNRERDVFAHDVATGVTTRVSIASDGTQTDDRSIALDVSFDGRFVVFRSRGDALVPGDVRDTPNIFLRDRLLGTTTLVDGCCGRFGDGPSFDAAFNGDGTLVAFSTSATDLAPGPSIHGAVVLRDISRPDPVASATNYGAGYPGTLGIPNLVVDQAPRLGVTVTVSIDNSASAWTIGFLFAGAASASIPTSSGGTLLVDELYFSFVPLVLPPGPNRVVAAIPDAPYPAGFTVFLQVLELDDGAAYGVSFTPGLQVVLGG